MKEVAQSEEDKKNKESSSQDENHDSPAEVEQNKEQENLASDVSTLIRTGKTPKSKYIEDRINKVAGKTEQDALKTIVKDKNSLTILYKKEDLKYDLDKFLTWKKAPLDNSDSSKEDIVRTLVFRAVTPTTKAEHLPMAATVTDDDHLTWAQASKSTRKAKWMHAILEVEAHSKNQSVTEEEGLSIRPPPPGLAQACDPEPTEKKFRPGTITPRDQFLY